MSDDDETPPERKRKATAPGVDDLANNFDSPDTGKIRLVLERELPHAVQEGIRSEWNGTFGLLKKSWERGRLIFTIVMSIVAATWAADKWNSSLARRDEVAKKEDVESLQAQFASMGTKIDGLTAALNDVTETLKKKRRSE